MATAPVDTIDYTQDALNGKFTEENWGNTLHQWTHETRTRAWLQPTGTVVEIVDDLYTDGDGNLRVSMYTVRSEEGETLYVKALRDDHGVLHQAMPSA